MPTHVVNVVESSVWQRCPLLQPQVSADEELGSRHGGRVLHVGQALHHHSGHSLAKHRKAVRGSFIPQSEYQNQWHCFLNGYLITTTVVNLIGNVF